MASKSDNEINFDATLRQHLKNSGAANVAACNRFDVDEANTYLERAMTANALSAYETHLADCAVCRRHVLELARLMPQVETEIGTETRPENSAPNFLADLRQWFSGWRLVALAGLGAATAALILFFVNVQFSSQQATVAVADKNVGAPSLRGAGTNQPTTQSPAQPNEQSNAQLVSTAQSRPSASLTDIAKLTEMAAKKSGESNLRIDGASVENSPAAPPPPAPATAAPKGEIAPKREETANNFNVLPNQVNASEWKQTTPTPTPRGPSLNQMQNDRALAMKKSQPSEAKAEQDKNDNPAFADRANESVAVTADSAGITRAKETEKIAEKGAEMPKAAPKRATTLAKPAAPTRFVAGKEFHLINGIWTDVNYNAAANLPLVKVKFDSDEYKKILSATLGLKPYFELQTVIVVWQGKAYRVEK